MYDPKICCYFFIPFHTCLSVAHGGVAIGTFDIANGDVTNIRLVTLDNSLQPLNFTSVDSALTVRKKICHSGGESEVLVLMVEFGDPDALGLERGTFWEIRAEVGLTAVDVCAKLSRGVGPHFRDNLEHRTVRTR